MVCARAGVSSFQRPGEVSNFLEAGGVGDSATDSTAALNAEIARIYAKGGGRIFFPAGQYVLQGVNLLPGVYLEGEGAAIDTGSFVDNAPTVFRMPVSPVANTPMFRIPKGTRIDEFVGGGVRDIMLIGAGASSRPSAFSANRLDCINLAVWQRQVATVDSGTDVWTSANHELQTADPVHFNNIGGALPTLSSGTFREDYTYYARRVSADTFSVHPTANDATNNTNVINFTGSGTGTHYVGRCCRNTWEFNLIDCVVRQFNIGLRGGIASSNNTAIVRSKFYYNCAGAWLTEHADFNNAEFASNHAGITGRFHDGRFRNVFVSSNNWGIVPWATANSVPFQTDESASDPTNDSAINSSEFTGCCFWSNVNAGLRITNNCAVTGGRIDGNPSDTNSHGISIQGNRNQITGVVFGGASLNFGLAAIGIDTSDSKTHYGTSIDACNFDLLGKPCIIAYDSQTGAVPGGAVGYVRGVSVRNCTQRCAGGRLIDFRSSNGLPWGCNVSHNTINRVADASATMSNSTDGIIEGNFYRSVLMGNMEHGSQSAKYYLIRNALGQDGENTYIGNRSESLTAAMKVTHNIAGHTLTANLGNSSVESP